MALTTAERRSLISAAAKLGGQVNDLALFAAAGASPTQLLLKANGVKNSASKLFDKYFADVRD